ncbi:MAG: hypothetical protein HC822_08570 [Oscillochloris sp.]|nr:hypothetical protein [Oscillochloris sp.]
MFVPNDKFYAAMTIVILALLTAISSSPELPRLAIMGILISAALLAEQLL